MHSNTTQIKTPLTRDDIDAIAVRVHGIRDGWHVASLVTLLTKLADQYDGPILRRAALAAAQDKNIRTPAGIEWTASDYVTPQTNSARTEPCSVCGKPQDKCMWERPLVRKGGDYDDHIYTTKAQAQAQAAKRSVSA